MDKVKEELIKATKDIHLTDEENKLYGSIKRNIGKEINPIMLIEFVLKGGFAVNVSPSAKGTHITLIGKLGTISMMYDCGALSIKKMNSALDVLLHSYGKTYGVESFGNTYLVSHYYATYYKHALDWVYRKSVKFNLDNV